MAPKIYAPNKQYNGEVGGVVFAGGEAHTDDPRLVDWFSRRGYTVGEDEAAPAVEHPVTGSVMVMSDDSVQVGEDEELSEGESLEDLTNDQLKERLKSLDLPVGGSKKELVERLQGALNE